MLAEAARHESIANNMANVSTIGFKRDTAVLRQQPTQMLHRLSDQFVGINGLHADLAPAVGGRGQGAVVEAILTNFQQGKPLETGNRMDICLQGQGFFMIDTARGRRYARQGNFSVSGEGKLVTMSGDHVLNGKGQPITVGNGNFEVNEEGIIFIDGEESGRLAVMIPDDPAMMVKEGEGLYAPAPGARLRASGARVVQGWLERSNVNPVLEMAEMLKALRAYEANQRAIMAQDETLGLLISRVGNFG